jgi:hypothetical protein
VISPACRIGTFEGELCSTEAVVLEDGIIGRCTESESEDDDDDDEGGNGDGDDEGGNGGDGDGKDVSGEEIGAEGDGDFEARPLCVRLLVRRGVRTVGFRRDRFVTSTDDGNRKFVSNDRRQ